MPLRLLIVDDHQGFLDAACAGLEQEGIDVVGTATSSAVALGDAEMLRPDAVLVDIFLGDESGFALVRQLVDAVPELRSRVVLMSARAEEDFADLIDASPAAGFIPKSRLSGRTVRELLAHPA
jgi:DNA-binding NarL/FixJ family response regulator